MTLPTAIQKHIGTPIKTELETNGKNTVLSIDDEPYFELYSGKDREIYLLHSQEGCFGQLHIRGYTRSASRKSADRMYHNLEQIAKITKRRNSNNPDYEECFFKQDECKGRFAYRPIKHSSKRICTYFFSLLSASAAVAIAVMTIDSGIIIPPELAVPATAAGGAGGFKLGSSIIKEADVCKNFKELIEEIANAPREIDLANLQDHISEKKEYLKWRVTKYSGYTSNSETPDAGIFLNYQAQTREEVLSFFNYVCTNGAQTTQADVIWLLENHLDNTASPPELVQHLEEKNLDTEGVESAMVHLGDQVSRSK